MNQTIADSIAAVMPAVRATGLLSSLCTIKTPPGSDTFDEGGAPDPNTPWDVFPDHEDIPCTSPPLSTGERVAASETKTEQEVMALSSHHVLLDAYYPTILSDYRAEIDGVDYDITNVESDSQKQMTRLAVQLATV